MNINVGGIKFTFTNTKLFAIITALSTCAGLIWSAALIYDDYMKMKEKITTYSAPDLSEFDKRLAVVEENSEKTLDYTRDIKNDIKADIRKLEDVVEKVERSTKESQRAVDQDIRELRKDLNNKLKKALENPLANPASIN